MSAGLWFVLLTVGMSVVCGSLTGLRGAVGGFFIGIILWLLGGLFWLVSTGVDCAEERSDNPYDVSEKCDY